MNDIKKYVYFSLYVYDIVLNIAIVAEVVIGQ